jgi:hypothetical protein
MEDRDRIGLCLACRHARRVPSPRAVYWLCGLAAGDPRFAKYPRLPVRECAGYEPADAGSGEGDPADG